MRNDSTNNPVNSKPQDQRPSESSAPAEKQPVNPRREAAATRALLASTHLPTVNMLASAMTAMHVLIDTCPTSAALSKLCKIKYEGVVVDLSDPDEGLELLRNLRTLTSNKGAVCWAVLNHRSETAAAFRAGANFVLERPLQPEIVTRTMEAAHPMMLLERRRYFRCAVQISTHLIREDGSAHDSQSINLSERGMALDSLVLLRPGEAVQIRFQVPGFSNHLLLSAQVCWAQPPGRAGIQFTDVPNHAAELLQQWLSERLTELVPHPPTQ